MQSNGFKVLAVDVPDTAPIRKDMNMPASLGSCHTAVVDDYVIEGHVPLLEIERMLAEKPAIRGIAVPGMPMGSPGMEMGETRDAYDVVAFAADGTRSIFAHYAAKS